MRYQVIVQPPARLDIGSAYLYIHDRAPLAAGRWLDGMESAILSLAEFPKRCPLAPESKEFPEEIRQLLYGRRAGKYRILFGVRGEHVRVLHVRHGARRWLGTDEIEP